MTSPHLTVAPIITFGAYPNPVQSQSLIIYAKTLFVNKLMSQGPPVVMILRAVLNFLYPLNSAIVALYSFLPLIILKYFKAY